ncbi:tRNA-specific 2-thiouridylase MnmA [mine drainage metagenome]|uniref:tRNA-specific 2-thiouridylase MnmA n=1 Tax=mine drainage metagenome TaxID=410659 RepID=T1AXU8_9ZZZZ
MYRERVFEPFLEAYAAGLTPNPDVSCNREIKFGVLWNYAQRLGATHLATGHYAMIRESPQGLRLLRARDRHKDQTYFLNQVDRETLSHCLFPIGQMTKPEVRALARRRGLPTHAKKDSTGICFIGERPFRPWLQNFLPVNPGLILDESGHILGEHSGTEFYNLGQRRGLGIGGVRGAREGSWYIYGKDHEANILRVTQNLHHPALWPGTIRLAGFHWIGPVPPSGQIRGLGKTRYLQPDAPCEMNWHPDRPPVIQFDHPVLHPLPDNILSSTMARSVSVAEPLQTSAWILYQPIAAIGPVRLTHRSADPISMTD